MIGYSSLESQFRPAGAGANYAVLTKSVDDDAFHENAEDTQWRQSFVKYTPHYMSMLVQGVQNSGASKTMSALLTKSPDLSYTSYTVSSWKGIQPNSDYSGSSVSYVNAKALFVNKLMRYKLSTQTLFEIDGKNQLVLAELMGVLEDFAPMIGFCYTKDQLIEDSRFDVIHYAPWWGFPMQDNPHLTFAIGSIAFHPMNFEQQNRSINELVVNYDGVKTKGRGILALPVEVKSQLPVSSSTVEFALATNCVWLSKAERSNIMTSYIEVIFKEHINAGEHSEGPCSVLKKVSFDLNVKGPTAYIWLTVQSKDDIESGNWIKTFDDYGLDYITEVMLITGTTPREDGLPASFYRTGKILEGFKVSVRRAIYLVGLFETNDKSKQPNGHQSMTNVERLSISMMVKPHKCILEFSAVAAVYNGVYTEKGGGGKMWG